MLPISGHPASCAHGQAAPTAVMSMFRFFEDELMYHIERKRCPAKVCRDLVRYEVVHHSDMLPQAEAICPTYSRYTLASSSACDKRGHPISSERSVGLCAPPGPLSIDMEQGIEGYPLALCRRTLSSFGTGQQIHPRPRMVRAPAFPWFM